MGIIEAAKLAFEYKKYDENGEVEETIRAVDGVDLDVKKGDFVAVLGHNGSGKSTLAKQINFYTDRRYLICGRYGCAG